EGPYGAGWSEGTGRVLAPRNGERCGEPPVARGGKAVGLGALWRVRRPPPGAESGAGLQRGNAGTWGGHLCACTQARRGGPGDHRLWRGLGAATRPRALRGDHARGQQARDRGTRATRSTPSRPGGRRRGASSRCTWGSEAQATHGREGAVGESVPGGARPERDSALAKRVTSPPWTARRGSGCSA